MKRQVSFDLVDRLHEADVAFLDQRLVVMRSEGLWKPSLAKNGICGVAAGNPNRHCEILVGDRAVPDFVAAFALANEATTRQAQ
jgi:hypothetical protein